MTMQELNNELQQLRTEPSYKRTAQQNVRIEELEAIKVEAWRQWFATNWTEDV